MEEESLTARLHAIPVEKFNFKYRMLVYSSIALVILIIGLVRNSYLFATNQFSISIFPIWTDFIIYISSANLFVTGGFHLLYYFTPAGASAVLYGWPYLPYMILYILPFYLPFWLYQIVPNPFFPFIGVVAYFCMTVACLFYANKLMEKNFDKTFPIFYLGLISIYVELFLLNLNFVVLLLLMLAYKFSLEEKDLPSAIFLALSMFKLHMIIALPVFILRAKKKWLYFTVFCGMVLLLNCMFIIDIVMILLNPAYLSNSLIVLFLNRLTQFAASANRFNFSFLTFRIEHGTYLLPLFLIYFYYFMELRNKHDFFGKIYEKGRKLLKSRKGLYFFSVLTIDILLIAIFSVAGLYTIFLLIG
ncbi:MAG: hypothetical protein ACTSRW_14525 [Candidatus Helarchaeota archaeon]